MRIIGGEFRSRKLRSPEGLDTRPTPDRLRESLFNILAPHIPGATFVDAYAGCGSVGLEAISRGAAQSVFIERNRDNVMILRENLVTLGAANRARVILGPVAKNLGDIEADIYFLDPPYEQAAEYEIALRLLEPYRTALIVAQHAARQELADACGGLHRTRIVKQGDNCLSFYRAGVD